mgnify:CR=1 FL=1|eukprot:scaffold326945_cov54-Tisochrysis_lutea.AAC.1
MERASLPSLSADYPAELDDLLMDIPMSLKRLCQLDPPSQVHTGARVHRHKTNANSVIEHAMLTAML